MEADLNTHGEELSEPNIQTITHSGMTVAVAREKLASIENKDLRSYQEQWWIWSGKIEREVRQMFNEFTAAVKNLNGRSINVSGH